MVWRSTTLIGGGIHATDGAIGSIADMLFDDTDWMIRWVVVDTGNWLPGRRVLLPPSCFGPPRGTAPDFTVELTRAQVKGSPEVDFDAPVSRQLETQLYGYYGWTPYWGLAAAAPMAAPGIVPTVVGTGRAGEPPEESAGDPHLRSAREVTGYYVHATDGDIGHVEEFLVDAAAWAIRYVVVDTANWWPGRKVLISPHWLHEIEWVARKVHLDVTREQVRASPEYDPSATLERAKEAALHAHYGVPPYWT